MAQISPTEIQKYTVKEVLNKALNTDEDALKVDIDNASITAGNTKYVRTSNASASIAFSSEL